MRIVQGTFSVGFGGLEMVILEFHQWLVDQFKSNPNLFAEPWLFAAEGTRFAEEVRSRGLAEYTIFLQSGSKARKVFIDFKRRMDSPQTAFLFHRQQALKALAFGRTQGKVSLLCHTFYGVQKKDLWHQYLFSKVDQWIVLSEQHKKNVIESMGTAEKKVRIIPNGVDRNKFRPLNQQIGLFENKDSKINQSAVSTENWNLSTHDFKQDVLDKNFIHLAVVARLDRQKGQDIALQAFALLQQKYPNKYKLHLIGEDTPLEKPFLPDLRQMANELNIAQHVIFYGYQPHIENLLPQFDLLWMPSHKETFGRCLLEAMACRVPVLASRAGGVPDIITHQKNGFLFETKNPADLALQTEKIFSDKNLLANCVQNAFADIENKYDQEKIWQRLLIALLPVQEKQAEISQ